MSINSDYHNGALIVSQDSRIWKGRVRTEGTDSFSLIQIHHGEGIGTNSKDSLSFPLNKPNC